VVSIVIPTKNAGDGFRQTLQAIRGQTGPSPELVVVDSGSSDGTPELAREFGVRTISVPPGSFNHGETRNLGLREARGDLCVLLVQDAEPTDETWLSKLTAPFSDERVVGVTGRQLPRPDADPLGRWEVEYHNRFLGETFRVQEIASWDAFLRLSVQERFRTACFDNVCSAVRRSFWEKQPFRPLTFAEDLDWGLRAVAAGARIAYNPDACVIHSHHRPPDYNLRRQFVSGKIVPKLLRVPPTDPGVRNDAEFFSLVGFLCGEVELMLAENVPDWPSARQLGQTCAANQAPWKLLLAALGLTGPPPNVKQNPMREHFYFLLSEMEAADSGSGSLVVAPLLIQALAHSIGIFAASYHNWCEANDCLSEDMRRLGSMLSQGV